MTTDFTRLSLSEMLAETEAIAAEAQQSFGHLDAGQLNWKPGAEAWSVAQCLEHLLVANRAMLRPIDKALAGTWQRTFFERLPVLPGLFGRLLVKSQTPGSGRKFKAPPRASPSASEFDAQIVSRFVTQQGEIAERLKGLERHAAARIVMTSPFISFITYSLLDGCRLIIAHERRHLAQAQRVMETSGFPR
ncbi:MAG TPA: DinB family protein [Blastocatellia bacterium]|nr:DinB family protein [Blastocatellia bacterium]